MKNPFTERNRTRVIFSVGIAVAFVLGQLAPLAANAQNTQQQTVTIEIAKGASSPASYSFFESDPIQVRLNTAVVWHNGDTISHHLVSGNPITGEPDGIWDTELLKSDSSSKPILFTNEDTYFYHCVIHPFMQGSLRASNWLPADFKEVVLGEDGVHDAQYNSKMALKTDKESYALGDTIKIIGKISSRIEDYKSFKLNPIMIRILDSEGKNKLYLMPAYPAEDGTFRASFKSSMFSPLGLSLSGGEYMISTAYGSEYGIAKFKVVEKKETVLTAKADGRSSTKFTQLAIGNSKDSGDSVYKVVIDMPKNVDVTKVIAPKGWKWAKDSNSVTFSTNTAPIELGRTGSFKLYTSTVIRSFDWTAYDSKDDEVGKGSMRVNMHR